jgi:hypothetical protein
MWKTFKSANEPWALDCHGPATTVGHLSAKWHLSINPFSDYVHGVRAQSLNIIRTYIYVCVP